MKKIALLFIIFSLSGCATISGTGTDNTPKPTPLVNYQAKINPTENWSTSTSPKKSVTLLNLNTGKSFWTTDLKKQLVAGPGLGGNEVVVGDNNGEVWGLSQDSGKVLWHQVLSDPIIAPPVIVNNSAIVKTLDGQLWSLSLADGKPIWQYQHGAPMMVLAGGSKPLIVGKNIIVGYSDGKLAAYSIKTGLLQWKVTIAHPKGASQVEQMVDITGNTAISGNTIYVVTYQGNLAAVNTTTGTLLWKAPLSSYTGLAISPHAIFVTDQKSIVWAFNRQTGKVMWQQDDLKYRKLTAPVVMGNTIVIADGEGYVHWLSQSNGQTVGRALMAKETPIVSTPMVMNNHVIVLDSKGKVASYTLT